MKEGTDSFVAGNNVASTNPSNKSYDTNMVGGTAKWYAQLADTPVTLDDNNKLTLDDTTPVALGTTNVTVGDDSNSYAAIGKDLAVTIKVKTAAATVAAGVKVVVDTDHTNCTATIPTTPIVPAGGAVTAGQELNINIKLDSAKAAVGAVLKLKLADAT